MLNSRFKVIISHQCLIAVIFSAVAIISAPHYALSADNTAGVEYTPPPMFKEPEQGFYSRPIDLDDKADGQPQSIVRPSIKDLLGYKDLAHQESPALEIPKPSLKPAVPEHMTASRMPAVKKAKVKVDLLGAKEQESTKEASESSQTILNEKTKGSKILNARDVNLMPDEKRTALVDMIFANPMDSMPEPSSQRNDHGHDRRASVGAEITDNDSRSLASMLKDKTRILKKQITVTENTDSNSHNANPEEAQSPVSSDLNSRQTKASSDISGSTSDAKALKPPQDIIDDVHSVEDDMIVSAAQKSDQQDHPLLESEDINEEIALRLGATEPAAAPDEDERIIGRTLPDKTTAPIGPYTLTFERGQTELTTIHKDYLRDDLLKMLQGDPTVRVEIKAFAARIDDTQSGARRISLARALAVREYMMNIGVDPDRMDLRALGESTEQKPVERVDIEIKNAT